MENLEHSSIYELDILLEDTNDYQTVYINSDTDDHAIDKAEEIFSETSSEYAILNYVDQETCNFVACFHQYPGCEA
jgi:hypothetical protein